LTALRSRDAYPIVGHPIVDGTISDNNRSLHHSRDELPLQTDKEMPPRAWCPAIAQGQSMYITHDKIHLISAVLDSCICRTFFGISREKGVGIMEIESEQSWMNRAMHIEGRQQYSRFLHFRIAWIPILFRLNDASSSRARPKSSSNTVRSAESFNDIEK
jgi:hypothetical protein